MRFGRTSERWVTCICPAARSTTWRWRWPQGKYIPQWLECNNTFQQNKRFVFIILICMNLQPPHSFCNVAMLPNHGNETRSTHVRFMLLRLHRNGPPGVYGCWVDESENSRLKAWSAAAHGSVFHTRVLAVAAAEVRARHVAVPRGCD